jgi:hypothetical protein
MKGVPFVRLNRVERKLFCSEFILDVGHYSYIEFAPRKMYHFGALDSSSIINFKRRKMKGVPFDRFNRVKWKLFCSEFILDVGHYSYIEFAPRKIFHSWALDSSSIINFKRRKMKGNPFVCSIELSRNFFAQNSFWMLAIIPT